VLRALRRNHFLSLLLSIQCECWRYLGINWNFNLNFHQMMLEARQQCPNPFFMEFFMLGV
jgi:hypothetical protein